MSGPDPASGTLGMSRKPSFIGVGAGKCGTSWLVEMLCQHPSIYVPEVKELHYFNDLRYELRTAPNPVAQRPIEWYLNNFADAPANAVCGEFSTHYLWNETAPRRIWEFDPEVKLLVVLRDPVERLQSVHLFSAQRGYLRPGQTFEETLEQYPHSVDRSRYGAALARFLEYFPREAIHVAFHNDLRLDPTGEVMRIQHFLGVEPHPPTDIDRQVNVTGTPRHPRLTRMLWNVRGRALETRAEHLVSVAKRAGLQRAYRGLRRADDFKEKPTLDPATTTYLRDLLREDVELLEEILKVPLTDWKSGSLPPISSEA